MLPDSPASASQLLGLQARATTSLLFNFFKSFLYMAGGQLNWLFYLSFIEINQHFSGILKILLSIISAFSYVDHQHLSDDIALKVINQN
jgi:hypothetical protein